MTRKGRQSRGADRHNVVLTEEQVRELRAAKKTRGMLAKKAREMGVNYFTAWDAATSRKSWTHVQ